MGEENTHASTTLSVPLFGFKGYFHGRIMKEEKEQSIISVWSNNFIKLLFISTSKRNKG